MIPRRMTLHDAPRRRWIRIVLAVGMVLVLFVVVDVRPRARIVPLPPESAAHLSSESGRLLPFGHSTSAHRTDLTAYTAAARVLSDGGSAADAYRAQSPRGWRYQYMPLLAALLTPIAGMATKTQALIFGLLSAAIALAVLVECRVWWRLLAAPPDAPRMPLPAFIAIAAALAIAMPTFNTLQRGQVGLLVLWPLMFGFRTLWMSRSRRATALGGACLAFPAVLKLIPLMTAGLALVMVAASAVRSASVDARRRATAGIIGFALGTLLFVAVVPALFIGPSRTIDATGIFVRSVVANPDFSQEWQFERHANRNQSLDSAAWKLLRFVRGEERVAADPLDLVAGDAREPSLPRAFQVTSMLVRGGLSIATLVVVAALARRGMRDAFAGFGLACLATLVVSPVSWGHHFTMLLPTMIAVPAWLESRGRSASAFAVSAILCGAVLIHYAAVDLAGATGVLGLASSAVLVALLVCAWPRRMRSMASRPRSMDTASPAVRITAPLS